MDTIERKLKINQDVFVWENSHILLEQRTGGTLELTVFDCFLVRSLQYLNLTASPFRT